MKNKIQYLILLILFHTLVFCQEKANSNQNIKLIKDLDGDGIKDTIFIRKEESRIVCKLSSYKFNEIKSKEIEILNDDSGITETKNGFEFYNNWMRAGYSNQFRYDSVSKKVQLIGMQRYEFGPANHDGSGSSSVNLLTNQYIGNWNYYNENKNRLIKIPTIKAKMIFPKIYLEDFSDSIYFNYSEKCSELYLKNKQILLRKK